MQVLQHSRQLPLGHLVSVGGQEQHFGRRDVGILGIQGRHGAYTLLHVVLVGLGGLIFPYQLAFLVILDHWSGVQVVRGLLKMYANLDAPFRNTASISRNSS